MSMFYIQYCSMYGCYAMVINAESREEATECVEEQLMFYDDEFFVEEYDAFNLEHRTTLEENGGEPVEI